MRVSCQCRRRASDWGSVQLSFRSKWSSLILHSCSRGKRWVVMFLSKADGGTSTPESDSCDQLFDQLPIEEEFADIFRLDPSGKTTGFQVGSAYSSRTPSTESLASSTSSRPSRNRYLYPKIDTVEPLRPEQVRWFYKGEGDKKWLPFIGYDSLRIECQYREAITRTGPQDGLDKRSDLINCRGGLYQVDVVERKCHPVYWNLKGMFSTSHCWLSFG